MSTSHVFIQYSKKTKALIALFFLLSGGQPVREQALHNFLVTAKNIKIMIIINRHV